jgi:hypothetical protein
VEQPRRVVGGLRLTGRITLVDGIGQEGRFVLVDLRVPGQGKHVGAPRCPRPPSLTQFTHCCLFPLQVTYPLTEGNHLGPPHSPNFGYAHGRRVVDVQNQ